ncbi:hypothetical protein A0J61_09750 [Choanephora cucurbitarum]|uniref:Uncharacterized protein n=1 Tax=Choanephora cucurbitarum TaxID=101091 RepID=A0A1C7MZA6_9FUNG|nr:hypothetical protein A0J61_09750 [Choanephora cucurbitarum]
MFNSNYELKRKLNIQENESLLKELGLHGLKKGIAADIPNVQIEKKKKRRMAGYNKKTSVITTTPARLSRRLRGEMPIEHFELDDILDDHDRVKQLEIAENKKQEQEIVINNLPNDISVPFTLRSIGTTVWSLGELVKGRGRSKAWSSRGCKYKHPYPIGYRATKSHFGNDYTMGILPPEREGEGPVFTVQHNNTIWKGPTPTAPWTEACIKSRSSQTRVSGPLVSE